MPGFVVLSLFVVSAVMEVSWFSKLYKDSTDNFIRICFHSCEKKHENVTILLYELRFSPFQSKLIICLHHHCSIQYICKRSSILTVTSTKR